MASKDADGSAAPGQEANAAAEVAAQTATTDSVALSQLGPIVIEPDGRTSRIANWATMTTREQQTAMKLVARRNEKRRKKLLAEGRDIQLAEPPGSVLDGEVGPKGEGVSAETLALPAPGKGD